MKTKAVRIYGKNDLRLEEFELPAMKDDEILAKVVCDSICMSSYKAAHQGKDHKRIPKDIDVNPTMIGHEFSGELLEVGPKWKDTFKPGMKFSIQPAINYPDSPVGILGAPGYSYRYIGGDATYIIIPNEIMELDCLLPFNGKGFYPAALAEPLSCVIGAMHANYHNSPGTYVHEMGIAKGGNMAMLAAAGPMGISAINYAIHTSVKPGLMVVTDIDQARLDRASSLFSPEYAATKGIQLKYINTKNHENPSKALMELTDNKGFNDVFVFAPVPQVFELADEILSFNGCINFFAGPEDPNFKAKFNLYNLHYNYSHVVGTSGGNNEDMKEAISMMSDGLDPAGVVTHIGGLDAVIPTTFNLPKIPGGKKLIYTHLSMELTALADLEEKGKTDHLFKELSALVSKYNGLWNSEAEEYLMKNGKKI